MVHIRWPDDSETRSESLYASFETTGAFSMVLDYLCLTGRRYVTVLEI